MIMTLESILGSRISNILQKDSNFKVMERECISVCLDISSSLNLSPNGNLVLGKYFKHLSEFTASRLYYLLAV